MNHSTPGLPVHRQLLEFTQTHVYRVDDAIHLCCPLLPLTPIPPSIRVFSNESTLCIRWPRYWSFSLSISPSSEYPGLISFRVDWLDLLAVQGTLKSLLQFKSIKYSVLNFLYSPTLISIQEKGKSKLHWSEWPSSKNLQTINAGEGVEEREFSCMVDGNVS